MSVFDDLVAKRTTPTRADIAALLADVGAPGEMRDEKVMAVRDLFDAIGGGINLQGVHVADDLTDYEAY